MNSAEEPAAIEAHLVDMRNVGAHKSLKLTIHIPEEHALRAIEVFGWPTGVNPVRVGIARLQPDTVEQPAPRERKFDELPLSQQAGIHCNDPIFQAFCSERTGFKVTSEEEAAALVRTWCGVSSRSELGKTERNSALWRGLDRQFQDWKLNDRRKDMDHAAHD